MGDIYDFNSKKQEAEDRTTAQEVYEKAMENSPYRTIVITESGEGKIGLLFNDMSIAEVNLYLDTIKQELLKPTEV